MHDAEWLTRRTKDFLDTVPRNKPFVLQVNYKEPHTSSIPAPEDLNTLNSLNFERRANETKLFRWIDVDPQFEVLHDLKAYPLEAKILWTLPLTRTNASAWPVC